MTCPSWRSVSATPSSVSKMARTFPAPRNIICVEKTMALWVSLSPHEVDPSIGLPLHCTPYNANTLGPKPLRVWCSIATLLNITYRPQSKNLKKTKGFKENQVPCEIMDGRPKGDQARANNKIRRLGQIARSADSLMEQPISLPSCSLGFLLVSSMFCHVLSKGVFGFSFVFTRVWAFIRRTLM